MNQRIDCVIPECYVDTNLVETLMCGAGCNHQKGCNQVAKVMQEKFADRFAVGIIDADKRKPSYLNEFRKIVASEHIELFCHRSRPHFMILVNPAMDGFLLSCAKTADVDMADYELSADLKKFTVQTKNVMSNKDIRFKKLFRSLENVGEIRLLKSLLSYFVAATYQSSEDILIGFFHS